jgi:hypothetical protein
MKKNFSIIGLTGRAGAGKDTVAEILDKHHGYLRVAFADALRSEVAQAFGINMSMMIDRDKKEKISSDLEIAFSEDRAFIEHMRGLGLDICTYRSPREILRLWGTEYRRQTCSETYWLDRMSETIDGLMRVGVRRIAITDVRFVNEANFVKEHQGMVWRVVRHSSDVIHADHLSETEQNFIDADLAIDNNGSLSDLTAVVNKLFEQPHDAAKE